MSEVKGALSDVKNGVKLFQSKLFGACDMTDENGVEVFMDTVAGIGDSLDFQYQQGPNSHIFVTQTQLYQPKRRSSAWMTKER